MAALFVNIAVPTSLRPAKRRIHFPSMFETSFATRLIFQNSNIDSQDDCEFKKKKKKGEKEKERNKENEKRKGGRGIFEKTKTTFQGRGGRWNRASWNRVERNRTDLSILNSENCSPPMFVFTWTIESPILQELGAIICHIRIRYLDSERFLVHTCWSGPSKDRPILLSSQNCKGWASSSLEERVFEAGNLLRKTVINSGAFNPLHTSQVCP